MPLRGRRLGECHADRHFLHDGRPHACVRARIGSMVGTPKADSSVLLLTGGSATRRTAAETASSISGSRERAAASPFP